MHAQRVQNVLLNFSFGDTGAAVLGVPFLLLGRHHVIQCTVKQSRRSELDWVLIGKQEQTNV